MTKKLSWDEIEITYDQEWVELVDFDWPACEPYPLKGIVRSHGSNRQDFYRRANRKPRPRDSAILFVGKLKVPTGTSLCSSLMRIEHANPEN